jgi:hypothetical protein
MAEEACYRYRIYDITIDDYRYSTRYATNHKINRIHAEPVYPGVRIDEKYLTEGWTDKNFDPANPSKAGSR